MALAKFNVDLFVVCASTSSDVALWYPQAMVDAAGTRIGERLAADTLPMRIVWICNADVARRRIKIRRGKIKQDAWLPDNLEICGVAFHMMGAAVDGFAAQEEDGAESDADVKPPRAGAWAEPEDAEDQEDGEAQQVHEVPEQQPRAAIEDTEDHEDDDAEQEQLRMLISTMVARQIMHMRIYKDDQRSNGDIAADVLQFVQLRNKFVRKHNLCVG